MSRKTYQAGFDDKYVEDGALLTAIDNFRDATEEAAAATRKMNAAELVMTRAFGARTPGRYVVNEKRVLTVTNVLKRKVDVADFVPPEPKAVRKVRIRKPKVKA